MLRSVFLKTLRDLRRGFVWWSIGLASVAALQVSVYPSVRDNTALKKLVEDYPNALKGFIGFGGELDYVTAPGYLGMELFSLVVPLLITVAAISAGSAAVAGEEERGTLELLLALPVSRTRLVLEKLAALVVEAVALGLVLWLSLWLGAVAVGMHIGADKLGAATAGAVALGVAFGSIALLVGCASGRRGWAVAAAAAAAVGAYLVNSLAPLVAALDSVQKLTPFYHYAAGDPLRAGIAPDHLLVLVAIAAAASALAVATFSRRDVAG